MSPSNNLVTIFEHIDSIVITVASIVATIYARHTHKKVRKLDHHIRSLRPGPYIPDASDEITKR